MDFGMKSLGGCWDPGTGYPMDIPSLECPKPGWTGLGGPARPFIPFPNCFSPLEYSSPVPKPLFPMEYSFLLPKPLFPLEYSSSLPKPLFPVEYSSPLPKPLFPYGIFISHSQTAFPCGTFTSLLIFLLQQGLQEQEVSQL